MSVSGRTGAIERVHLAGNQARPGLKVLSSNVTVANTTITDHDIGIHFGLGASLTVSNSNVWGNTTNWVGYPDPTGTNGNIAVDPEFLDTTASDPVDWDLHLALTSPLVDAGDPTLLDPDGSPSDIGAFGGPDADLWDLDGDGYPSWWQPGPYNYATYPGLGLDCDDLDIDVVPGDGC